MLLSQTAAAITQAHPQDENFHALGQQWHADIIDFARHDLPKLLIILLIAFLLARVVSFFVHRIRAVANTLVGNPQRASQLRTIAAIFRATCYGLIGFLTTLQVLPLFNIDLKPLLASAGVVGLGISFGAQSLFKDMLNGAFILVEDQFNVGDVVRIAGLTGTVEDLSLRSTTLRDGDGTLHFIPNSQIATVSNQSRQYSVASLPVSVDASADPDRVLEILRQVSLEVRRDPAFANVAVADPDILGVDRISGREVIYTINIRVRANQRDGILRAIRRKLLLAFEKEGIPLGTPTSTVIMQGARDPTANPAAPTLTGS